ncbi:MAG: DUF1501 domain-containing protein, partial [Planctomycetota bacterium]|nr:DUF1501 domain-containing protein [Planctomycetota bacterium]
LKPVAPTEVRGPCMPISTNVQGLSLCELLPLHSRIANRFSLIRSCTHGEGGHFEAHGRFMSGDAGLKPGTFESTHPQMAAIVGRALKSRVRGLPAAVGMGLVIYQSAHGEYLPGIGNGYWSSSWRPPIVTKTGLPDSTLTIEGARLDDRVTLLRQIDRLRRDVDSRGVMDSVDEFSRTAIEILTADKVRQAFDLSREDPRLIAQYGDEWGQNALVARRLVEAGVSFVTISVPGGVKAMDAPGWDDHAINIDLPTIMRHRLPVYDQVATTLINDLYDRGLDKKVLLIAAGEFGRTPKGTLQPGTATGKLQWGRDHWPGAQSILISGGGFRMGQVIGASDRSPGPDGDDLPSSGHRSADAFPGRQRPPHRHHDRHADQGAWVVRLRGGPQCGRVTFPSELLIGHRVLCMSTSSLCWKSIEFSQFLPIINEINNKPPPGPELIVCFRFRCGL